MREKHYTAQLKQVIYKEIISEGKHDFMDDTERTCI